MANSLFVTAMEPHSGKSAVTLGLMQLLLRNIRKVAFFRPIIACEPGQDPETELMIKQFNLQMDLDDTYACTLADARDMINSRKQQQLMELILQKFKYVSEKYDFVLCEGTDYASADSRLEVSLNLEIASTLDSPLALVASGTERSKDEIHTVTLSTLEFLAEREQELACVLVNRARVSDEEALALKNEISAHAADVPVYVIQENDILSCPSMGDVQRSLNAEVVLGEQHLDTLIDDYLTAAMQVGNFLEYLKPGALIVTPGDRSDIVLAALAATASANYPKVGGILLTGGLPLAPSMIKLVQGLDMLPIPILSVKMHTYKTIMALAELYATIKPSDTRKIYTAIAMFERCVDGAALADRLISRRSTRMTPMMFEYKLIEMARRHRMRIVLPEGAEERILRATEVLVKREVAEIILLGDVDVIHRKISNLGLDLDNVTIIDPEKSSLFDDYVQTYYELRKAKGIPLDQARDRMADATYFGSMMVKKGDADGMVSGSINTTAHTIRPAFEFIKTKPGFSNVSSVFLMCMKDRVLVFGDCAVNPNPTAEQLAEIAIVSAQTAAVFGIEPRVAMLSYSTGTSGKGADVDVVIEATRIAHERAPELMLEGPIQYDAAIEPSVAKTKLPNSQVAGRATVFIFPDLNTGNNTYKAVQRSAGVTAIGPVLQGLNKPVNDLSRGCLVPDIINTVAITAIQAQAMNGLI